MWKRFLSIGTVITAVLALSLATAGVAEAGSKDTKWAYHLGDAFLGCEGVLPTDDPIDLDPNSATCRPEAVAEDFAGAFPGAGGSIAIQGEGELTVSNKGKLKKVKGDGLFAQFDENGNEISRGTWKARKPLLFEAYGEGGAFPGWESGRILMLIRLHPEGGKKVNAVLEVGCRLPTNAGNFGTIEGVRVMVDGGLNYNLPTDPKATVFVNLNNVVP
jgi:hypothetical protein